MAKVKDVFPSAPTVTIDAEWAKSRTLADIWAKYDEDTDSMLIYVTGKPVPGVNVYLGNDTYAIVDRQDGNKMIGLYFEAWAEFCSDKRMSSHLRFTCSSRVISSTLRETTGYADLKH